MTARPNENDPVDLDPARDPAYEIEELSKTGSELPPKAINPKTAAHPINMDSTQRRADDATDPSKVQTNVEAGIPPGSVEQSEQARADQGDLEREQPQSGKRKNENVESGARGDNVEREDDQRGAA
ncbi:MAG: hypothetical protein JWO13_1888 [Acidobacteriales bacterium]|nr:hypothetical protein [Terriglobales bacterium]